MFSVIACVCMCVCVFVIETPLLPSKAFLCCGIFSVVVKLHVYNNQPPFIIQWHPSIPDTLGTV